MVAVKIVVSSAAFGNGVHIVSLPLQSIVNINERTVLREVLRCDVGESVVFARGAGAVVGGTRQTAGGRGRSWFGGGF